jgi:elongation factor Ts
MTGAGMMDCKNALTETDTMEAAVEWLREKGLGKAAKKADRVAAEGLVAVEVAADFKSASISEVNSETDFVAKNEKFVEFTKRAVGHIHNNNIATVEELLTTTIDGTKFDEYLKTQIATIGENLVFRRFAKLSAGANSVVNGYLHATGRIAAIVSVKCDSEKTATAARDFVRQLAMHAAAMKPTVLSYKELDAEFVEKETVAIRANIEKENEELVRLQKPLKRVPEFVSRSQISDAHLATIKTEMEAELAKQGKPEKIWEKIIPGQLDKYVADNTLLDQQFCLCNQFFIMDDKLSIAQAVEAKAKELGGTIEVVEFVRFEVGEGIEKVVSDFASEVASQLA